MRVENGCFCPECGNPVDRKGFCEKHPDAVYPFFVPAFGFNDERQCTRNLIHLLKYYKRRDIGEFFGEVIIERLAAEEFIAQADGFVPVPLYKTKERDRGYNQSEVVAGPICKKTGLPMLSKAVKRIKCTDSQTKQENAKKRQENVAGAFQASDELSGKKVIIIDDVITTGATTRELAIAIKDVGGSVLCALCIARPGIDESKESEI